MGLGIIPDTWEEPLIFPELIEQDQSLGMDSEIMRMTNESHVILTFSLLQLFPLIINTT